MHVKQCDHKISFRSTENPKYFDLYLLLGCRTDTNEHCLLWLIQTNLIYSHFQGKRNPSLSNQSVIPGKLGKPRQKKTQKIIFWGLSQKKIMQHLIFNPHHLSLFCLNCQVVQNISAENENKGNDRHTHTYDKQLCHSLFWIENKCVWKKWPLTNTCRWTKQQGLKSCLNLSLVTWHCYKIWISPTPNLIHHLERVLRKRFLNKVSDSIDIRISKLANLDKISCWIFLSTESYFVMHKPLNTSVSGWFRALFQNPRLSRNLLPGSYLWIFDIHCSPVAPPTRTPHVLFCHPTQIDLG